LNLRSINVGLPRTVTWRGRAVRTGIFKDPVRGPVRLREHNLEGDGQADIEVHGGPSKAVYAYFLGHYPWWEARLGRALPPGALGENLTVEGGSEAEVHVGDRYRVGTAEVVVTQPRLPCAKLPIRLDCEEAVRHYLEADRPGFYLAVGRAGLLAPGDALDLAERPEGAISIAEVWALHRAETPDPDRLRRALAAPGLSASWRRRFRARLASA